MKRGFTIIELLVASLLLSMLVSILTMMFNQSSIAWRTGTSGVVNMNKTRSGLGTSNDIRDEVLPGLGDNSVNGGASDNRTIRYRTVSLWKKESANELRTQSQRAFNFDNPNIAWGNSDNFTIAQAMKGDQIHIARSENPQNASAFAVGVRSLGPDGKPDTEDEITTWPKEID